MWWEATKLIPDVFVATMSLALLLMVFRENSLKQKIVLHLIIVFSAVTHLSHLAVFLGFILLLMLTNLYGIRKRLWKEFAVLGLGALALVLLSNVLLEGRFQLAKGNTIFVLGKLNEAGVLDLYLEEHCAEDELALCAYKDSLPATAWQFVWDPNGAIMKLGGWDAKQDEYKSVVKGILTAPKYWPILSYKAGINAAVQLSQTKVGDNIYRQEKESNVVQSIARYYSHETKAVLWTKQFLLELPFAQLSWFYLFSLLLSLCWLLWQASNKRLRNEFVQFLLVLFILLLLNAFFTANLGNISSRLNARLIWLVPALIIIEYVRCIFTTFTYNQALNSIDNDN